MRLIGIDRVIRHCHIIESQRLSYAKIRSGREMTGLA
jgi:hypothetical protein